MKTRFPGVAMVLLMASMLTMSDSLYSQTANESLEPGMNWECVAYEAAREVGVGGPFAGRPGFAKRRSGACSRGKPRW